MPAPDDILDSLRKIDRDRYFACLVLPVQHRAAVAALYAFAADVSLVGLRIREPAAGEIRLQWWADALAGNDHGGVRANPVAAALLDTVATYGLPVQPLIRLISARRFDLYQDPMPDLHSFEGYAGEVNGTLFQLAVMILNDGQTVEDGTAAGHLGVAQALVGHMRAFGFNAARGRIFLPWTVLAANGVREAELFSGTTSEGLVEAFGQFHEMARDHLERAEAGVQAVPSGSRAALAPLAVIKAQLELFARRGTPLGPEVDLADWQKLVRLAWWARRHRR